MRRLFYVFLLTFASAGACRAADCENDSTQFGLDLCAQRAFEAADAQLNARYKQILARLKDDANTKALLATSEKAWIAFRDADCAFSTSASADGSMHPMVVSYCLEGQTKARIKQFDDWLHCEEGDMNCPVPAH